MVLMAAGCKQGQAQDSSFPCQLYISRQAPMPVAATLLSLHSLIGSRVPSCSNMGLPMHMHWRQCLLPPPCYAQSFPTVFGTLLLQDVSYEPECQVWSINNDALQPFVLS